MPVTRHVRRVVSLALLTLLLSPISAGAHLEAQTDANDPGVLDIRKTSLNHKNGKIIHSVTTDGAWTAGTLAAEDGEDNKANDNDIELLYETKGDAAWDFLVLIDSEEGKLTASLYRWRAATTKWVLVEGLGTPIKDGKTVKVKFAKGKIDASGSVNWHSSTFYTGGNCDLCKDYAPGFNEYWVHNL
ncbi:MAG: hypothetical protein M3285_07585 [Actinomycetota bacterium]|nr:hypothetical protein [Actinomycetota bacterium]